MGWILKHVPENYPVPVKIIPQDANVPPPLNPVISTWLPLVATGATGRVAPSG